MHIVAKMLWGLEQCSKGRTGTTDFLAGRNVVESSENYGLFDHFLGEETWVLK